MSRLFTILANPLMQGRGYTNFTDYGTISRLWDDSLNGRAIKCVAPGANYGATPNELVCGSDCNLCDELYYAMYYLNNGSRNIHIQATYNTTSVVKLIFGNFDTGSLIYVLNNSGTGYTSYTDSRLQFSVNSYYLVEVKIKYGEFGNIQVLVDGKTKFNRDLDIRPSGTSGFNRWGVGLNAWNNYGIVWYAINDTTGVSDNSWIRNLNIKAVLPNSDVSPNEYNKFPDSGTYYSHINNLSNKSDLTSSELWTETGGMKTRHGVEDHTIVSGVPKAVEIHIIARDDYARGCYASIIDGANSIKSDVLPLQTDHRLNRPRFLTAPDLSEWTFDSMKNFDIEIESEGD